MQPAYSDRKTDRHDAIDSQGWHKSLQISG